MEKILHTFLRTCKNCGLEAHTDEDLKLFKTSRTSKYGKAPICKKCEKERVRKWRKDNPEYVRKYHVNNKETENKYRETHKEHIKERKRKWRKDNPEYFRKWRESSPFKYVVSSIKSRTKKSGLDFDLDQEYIQQIWDECGGICPMTGVPMLKISKINDARGSSVMSVDRIDPNKGYVKENIRLVSYWYNRTRSNYSDEFTLEMCQRVIDLAH